MFNKFLNILKKIKNTENFSAILVLVIATVMLSCYGIYKYVAYSNNIKKELKDKANYVSDLGSLILKEPVWNYDQETIKSIVFALHKDKEIKIIELKNFDGSVIAKNSDIKNNDKLIISDKTLIKNGVDEVGRPIENQQLGTIRIGITPLYKEKNLNKELINSFVFISITLMFAYYSINAFIRQEKDSKERISSVLNNMVDSVITVNKNLIIKSCNSATEKLFDYKPEELLGENLGILLQLNNNSENTDNFSIETLYEFSNKEIIGLKKSLSQVPIEYNVGTINLNNEDLYVLVIRDITQRHEIDRVKNEFISIVSHELRTPLTSIMGSLDLIISNEIKDEEMSKQLLKIAKKNSSNLLNLINSILDIEKLDQDKMEFFIKKLNINEVINEVIKTNKVLLKKEELILNFTSSYDDIEVLADKDKLIQVITNILSNAIKFSEHGGTIDISVEKIENKKVRVYIKDYGAGIDDADKDKIFEKFVQADSSVTRKKGGTGLGLAICKNIILKMNGNIGFVSKVGEGSSFYFDLPIA